MTEQEPEERRLPDPAHLPAGYVLGDKYEIKRLLGEGASGSVYEGEHGEIGHRVAIKVVHKDLAEREDIVARFKREARICGTIRNRHVGQVYDVGELPGGAPYMVMELHEGGSLAQLLQGGQLAIGTAVEIGRQLLLGLQAAHDIGVVHRDVKPDNVMLVREAGGQLLVKLVDFGIGKTLVADLSSRAVTLEGMVVGSPDYMPPEQLKGERVDHRADLYATGVVLYEMITGRVPFDAASLTELFVAILRDPLRPPRELRPDCPIELEQIVLRALSRAADERHASATEMERALAAVQNEHRLSVSMPPPGPGIERPSSRSQARRVGSSPAPIVAGGPFSGTPPVFLNAKMRRAGLLGSGVLALIAALLIARGNSDEVTGRLKGTRQQDGEHTVRPAHAIGGSPEQGADGAGPAADLRADSAAPPVGPPSSPSMPAPPQHASASGPRPSGDARRGARAPRAKAAAPAPAREPTRSTPSAVTPAAEPETAVSVSDLVREASGAFVRGQTPRARALYREAIRRAPESADAWRGLGMVSSRMGERNEAAIAFRRYLQLRPDAPDARAIRQKLDAL